MMFRRRVVLSAALICLLSTVQVSLLAQDNSERNSPPLPGETPRKSLDDKLLDGLPAGPTTDRPQADPATPGQVEGAHAAPPGGVLEPLAEGSDVGPQNPLQRINRHMHQVQQRLTQRDVSSETQQRQRQIITDLDELIAALAAQQQSAAERRRNASKTGNDEASRAGTQAARDSTGQPGKDETLTDESAAMRQAAGEIWGHLPERFRRQMQNPGAVEFLPKYRKLIEDYYKRLAEDRAIQQ